jgi:hypothetical protein
VALAVRLQPYPPPGCARAADDVEGRARPDVHVHGDIYEDKRRDQRYRYVADGRHHRHFQPLEHHHYFEHHQRPG